MKTRVLYRAGVLMLVLILVLSGCASNSGSQTGQSSTSQWISDHEKTLIGGLGAATAGGLLGAAFHLGRPGSSAGHCWADWPALRSATGWMRPTSANRLRQPKRRLRPPRPARALPGATRTAATAGR